MGNCTYDDLIAAGYAPEQIVSCVRPDCPCRRGMPTKDCGMTHAYPEYTAQVERAKQFNAQQDRK